MSNSDQPLREAIFAQVRRFYAETHVQTTFVAGETPVAVSGRVFDADRGQGNHPLEGRGPGGRGRLPDLPPTAVEGESPQ